MTNEQLGRAWCAKNGKRPDECPRRDLPPFRWVYDDGPVYGLPKEVFDRMSCGPSRYATEADAYADVGAALRELVADSDTLCELADEVRSLEATAGQCCHPATLTSFTATLGDFTATAATLEEATAEVFRIAGLTPPDPAGRRSPSAATR